MAAVHVVERDKASQKAQFQVVYFRPEEAPHLADTEHLLAWLAAHARSADKQLPPADRRRRRAAPTAFFSGAFASLSRSPARCYLFVVHSSGAVGRRAVLLAPLLQGRILPQLVSQREIVS